MKIRMLVQISGPRGDGSAWPGIGQVADVSDAEGVHMCTAGLANPVRDDAPEVPALPEPEMRDVVVEGDGTVDTSARDALVPNKRGRR